MNAAFIFIFGIIFLFLGFIVYGKHIRAKLFPLSESKPTPANTMTDGVDYVPAKPLVLFGHHFASIAGAGPIVGPLVAVGAWGWLPVLLWVLLGSVFMGGVHDYLALMISVRNGGISIAEAAEKAISKRARWLFSVFVWLSLVLVVAVFAVVTAKTLLEQPEIVIPTIGLIPLAMIFGYLNYKTKLPLGLNTVIALALLILMLYLGSIYPIPLKGQILSVSAFTFTFVLLLIYALFASILPVWILLQPRDYLSVWILFAGLFAGAIGLIVAHPNINAPMFSGFTGSQQGAMWPMLFVIVACGAISGFHSLVASGTTSKQLASEKQGLTIGYGGMLLEGALALVALFSVSAGLVWASSTTSNMGINFKTLISTKGWIVTFATGFGEITSHLPFISRKAGKLFGMLMLNGFVLTTLDTATRLGRFLFTEIVTGGSPQSKRGVWYSNRWFASFVGIVFAYLLGSTNSWQSIWPVFGSANQLVAALALIVATSYLFGVRKPSLYSAIPGAFMLITTIGALVYKSIDFANKGNIMLVLVADILIILSILVLLETIKFFKQRRAELSEADR
ncbi:carbon starvation protein A [bacterium]|nr:MAG: carbon starvation protein A [bacterium]